MKSWLESIDRKAEQFEQEHSAQIQIERRILLAKPSLDRTRQNKSFQRITYPPKNLDEHTRRREGDVNGILTHREEEDVRLLLPPCSAPTESVKKVSVLGEAGLAAVLAPYHQLSRLVLSTLWEAVDKPAVPPRPSGSRTIPTKAEFAFSW